MEQRKTKWREPAPAGQTEQLLASRYSQLLKWASVLTHGDEGKAQDTVQEFCLYFTLTKPDLSGVANLDGYLYTCLRHIYLSGLARSSREAQRFISVAEFDSFEFAIASNQSSDPLQRQNDLRRICSYAVWRKESSKSASYFILHFFHGYSRREIAEVARLPISAIYNKLKVARTEVKSHLEESGKLRIVNRDLPPEPPLSWTLLPTGDLFRELRETILGARISECLPEAELLERYRSSTTTPISCALLAHIVSCERCLTVIDRHSSRPTLQDREPLDGFGSSSGDANDITTMPNGMDHKDAFRRIRRRWGSVHEHRPSTLSIAVNGRIVALHDIQAQHSTLSARIEHPESAQFIEVFSEQDVRLALLPIGELPPEGPQIRFQRVALSDGRWLELNLTFDGLGLNSQVAYFDPALGIEVLEDAEDSVAVSEKISDTAYPHAQFQLKVSRVAAVRGFLRLIVPSSAMAWALALTVIIATAGYLAYRRTSAPMDAREILNQSVRIETANLRGQTEHQVLNLEEVSADGRVLQQGAVDMWKDGDGNRYVRRLYDSRRRLIAAEWRGKNGEQRSQRKLSDKGSGIHSHLPMNGFWDQDLSAQAFSRLDGKAPQIHAVEGGYELTALSPAANHPQLISATLVLDQHLRPIREIMRIRAGSEIHELRFVQAEYERRPSRSVPDSIFDPQHELHSTHEGHTSMQQETLPEASGTNLQLAQLQIAVLYQLNALDADTGEPIEVVRTPDGHVRVSGTVTDSSLKQKIVSHLETLENHQLLDLRLLIPADAHVHISGEQQLSSGGARVYDIGQTKPMVDARLRKYLQPKKLSGEQLDSAVRQYSHEALQHAQHALQHAYALKRLGSALSTMELKSIGLSSQQKWTAMVSTHATDLASELRALHGQLAEIDSSDKQEVGGNQSIQIENPEQFDQTATQLLHQAQNLNSDVGRLFTSNPSGTEQPDALLVTTINAIPLHQAEAMTHFAAELKTAGSSIPLNPPTSGHEKGNPKQP